MTTLKQRTQMAPLWAEITEAVSIGGAQALQIAFYEIADLPTIMNVIASNKKEPGLAGDLLEAARFKDAKGRERPVIQNGQARELARRYTLSCRDLTRGVSRDHMADLAGLSVYDMRLRPLCKAISSAALKAWGMELGWYKGRFRVLTAHQSAEKETKLLKYNVGGNVARAERKRRIAEQKSLPQSAVKSYQVTLFEGVIGEDDELLN